MSARQPAHPVPRALALSLPVLASRTELGPLRRVSPDADCLSRALRGDQDALAALVDRHYAHVLRLCRRLVGPQEAADLAQDTFVRAIERAHQYQGRAAFRTWLLAIALNLCRSRLRQTRREITADDLLESVSLDAPPSQGSEDNLHVRQAVATLPPLQRAVVVLRFYHDLSLEEISQVTGKSVSWVHRSLRSALLALKDALSDDD